MFHLWPHERLVILAVAEACEEAVYQFRMWRLEREHRRLTALQAQLALARRCDYEDMLWRHGDPRGTYGQYPPYTD
jgi:hypothetical protein